jgi:hypothetical protein
MIVLSFSKSYTCEIASSVVILVLRVYRSRRGFDACLFEIGSASVRILEC